MNAFSHKKGENGQDEQVVKSSDFGSFLANARKAKSHSVEEVSDYLKVPAQLINAIEQNKLTELPPPAFTQGYIRAYARYLSLSEEDVLQMYNLAVPHELASELKLRSKLPGETNSQSPLIKLITTVLLLAAVTALIYGSYNYYQQKADDMESKIESKEHSSTGNSLNSPASQSGTLSLSIRKKTAVVDGSVTEKGGQLISTGDSGNLQPGSDSAEAVTRPINTAIHTKQAEPVINDDKIEIYAKKGAWLEVYDADEQRLFYNMLKKGSNKTLLGRAPFRVAVGNANSTRILVNSVELDIKNFTRSNNTASFFVEVNDNEASLY